MFVDSKSQKVKKTHSHSTGGERAKDATTAAVPTKVKQEPRLPVYFKGKLSLKGPSLTNWPVVI